MAWQSGFAKSYRTSIETLVQELELDDNRNLDKSVANREGVKRTVTAALRKPQAISTVENLISRSLQCELANRTLFKDTVISSIRFDPSAWQSEKYAQNEAPMEGDTGPVGKPREYINLDATVSAT
jgi:hypothetical protein